MNDHILSPNTQAILLLCASFGASRSIEPKPLSLGEYNSLASWLRDNDITPQDLLDPIIQNKLPQQEIDRLEPHRIIALLNRGVMLGLAIEQWTNQGIWVLGRGDAEYPQRLKKVLKYQAPAILYGVGNKRLLSKGGLAIVGSRNADDTALKDTEKIAHNCVREGIQIISGGAKGVDLTSMLSALEMGGNVMGVMANSLAKTALTKKYRTAIKKGHLTLISPYDPNAGFNVGNAMGRNKHIYGLADYTLVINSAFNQGGTWAGATEALLKIKSIPVLVRIAKNVEKGNYKLLEKGAIPFENYANDLSLKNLLNKLKIEFFEHQSPSIIISQPSILDGIIENNTEYSSLLTERREKNIDRSIQENNQNQQNIKEQKSLIEKPKDIYQAVLPFILQNLKQPKDDKTLAKLLEVQIGQMRLWLKKAVAEGIIRKNKRPVTYEIIENEN